MFRRTALLTIALLLATVAGSVADTSWTVWLVSFNKPAKCTPPGCSEDDIFEDAVTPQTCVAYLTGQRVQRDGKASFAASYPEKGSVGAIINEQRKGNCINNADKAELHLVAQTHGNYTKDLVDDQITMFFGGCNPECGHKQAAVFLPGANKVTMPVVTLPDFAVVPGAWSVLWREENGIRFTLHSTLPKR